MLKGSDGVTCGIGWWNGKICWDTSGMRGSVLAGEFYHWWLITRFMVCPSNKGMGGLHEEVFLFQPTTLFKSSDCKKWLGIANLATFFLQVLATSSCTFLYGSFIWYWWLRGEHLALNWVYTRSCIGWCTWDWVGVVKEWNLRRHFLKNLICRESGFYTLTHYILVEVSMMSVWCLWCAKVTLEWSMRVHVATYCKCLVTSLPCEYREPEYYDYGHGETQESYESYGEPQLHS